jgi:predicted ATPase with chaperone activity
MLARRLTTILPTMTLAEAIETTRPCRAPPHTISGVGRGVAGAPYYPHQSARHTAASYARQSRACGERI